MRNIGKYCMALIFSLTVLMTFVSLQAHAEFPDRPVAFVVVDRHGSVDNSAFSSWRQVVKWAYHFPNYKLQEDTSGAAAVLQAERKIGKTVLSQAAEAAGADVIVVADILSMREDTLHGNIFRYYDYDDGPFVLVETRADLYVYKKDGAKFLRKRIREADVRDLGNYEKPVERIKWALSKLVNTMEGRPIIGE